jgi:L-threonylcarbamoyladenylate synthase
MRIFKIDPQNPDAETVKKASEVLRIGGVIVYPTDTIYGIGANILDIEALQRVFEIKRRRKDKPLSVVFKSIDQVRNFTKMNPAAEKLAVKFLPGPLTMILEPKVSLDPLLGESKVGVRLIDHPVVSKILEQTKFPITATSANISGGKNPTDAVHAVEQVGSKVDLVLDAGPCKHMKPSTVVDLSQGKVEVLREGAIKKDDLEKAL